MSLLLYAITDGGQTGQAQKGVGAQPVRPIGQDGLVALVSEHAMPPSIDEQSLWAFEAVIEAHMSDRTVLPARFGSLIEDAGAVEHLLRDRRSELQATMERIRGAVELSVRAIWPGGEPSSSPEDERPATSGAGTDYMLARAALERRARRLAAALHETLDPFARSARYRILSRPTAPVTAAFLVDRDAADQFVARVKKVDVTLDDVDLVCTGPWPAYSFVEGGGGG
ncbi:MAG: GvpL/GvpF family gas vesicle protein [Actinomycetota bacterium]|nr:GvpL/GvpF family gas vesicle protein [Actinomycetota bacterium]